MNRLLPWLMLISAFLSTGARGDDDDAEVAAPLPASPQAARYREECGSCHFAFPPNLLPAESWQKLLAGLNDHFKQNAEVDEPARRELERYLTRHASRRRRQAVAGAAPLRVSTLPWMLRAHDELAPAVYARPSVSSRANCPACHPGADQGSFDENRARIPR